jgi:hypothetical protein
MDRDTPTWKIQGELRCFEKNCILFNIGCSLRLYGSSKSALGLKTSDVNICVHEEIEVHLFIQ